MQYFKMSTRNFFFYKETLYNKKDFISVSSFCWIFCWFFYLKDEYRSSSFLNIWMFFMIRYLKIYEEVYKQKKYDINRQYIWDVLKICVNLRCLVAILVFIYSWHFICLYRNTIYWNASWWFQGVNMG